MTIRHPRTSSGIALLVSMASVVLLSGPLPRALSGQEPPASKTETPAQAEPKLDLLTVVPFDRITLIDGTVVVAEPVLPRPLPPYDPVKEEKKRRAKREIPAEGNIRLPGEKKKAKDEPPPDEEEDDISKLSIHLLQGEVRDFVIKRQSLKSIEYFENLLLAEGERATLARDYTRAFECFLRVQARDPKWRGLDDHVDRLLFAEGNSALLDGNAERGLRLLGELWTRRRDFPGLADKLAASNSGRAGRAFELGLYAVGRKILHDAEPLAPRHPLLSEVRQRFIKRATALAASAAAKDGPARVDDLAEALRVWPSLEGADAAYRQAFRECPTLEIAVDDIPRGVGPWIHTPADARISRQLYLPILAKDDEPSASAEPLEQLATKLTATDLGRRLVIEIRPDVPWSDGSRPVAAIDLAHALTDSAEPTSPRFLARWADLLDRVDTPDETHVEIRLTRATLKPGSWLLGPIGPAHAGGDGRVVTNDRGRELVVDGPYRWAATGPDRAELTRGDGSAATQASKGKLRRIKEVRFPSAAQTIGAFLRGEVALVAHVPPDRVATLAKTPDVKVGRYTRAVGHRIALDGRNPVFRNRSLRRGFSAAIDRKALLEDTVLRSPADEHNRASDGVFIRGDFADAPDVAPLGYDPLLARMLVAAAHKELGGQPIRLTFEYPAIPEAQAVAPKLVEAFNKAFKPVGVEVVAQEEPESVLESQLRAGRRFDMVYRATRYDDPVLDVGPLISPAYDAPPSTNPLASVASPRILQLLLQLERAPEFPTARGLCVQIDRECRDELPILPLWQVEEHYAWHSRVKGLKEATNGLYDGLATWEVEPWFARDSW
jgi:peptide/nickel transport system substrate-binding protein